MQGPTVTKDIYENVLQGLRECEYTLADPSRELYEGNSHTLLRIIRTST